MAKIVALVRREKPAQNRFDLFLIGLVMQTETTGDTDAVGIDHDGAGHMIDIAHDEIGGFSADTGQGGQLVERMGNLAVVALAKDARHRDDILRFGFVESAGFDVFRKLLGGAFGKIRGAGVALKQGGSDHIDACVGTLGGQARRDQTLQRIGILERTDRIGIFLFQRFDRELCNLFFGHLLNPFGLL